MKKLSIYTLLLGGTALATGCHAMSDKMVDGGLEVLASKKTTSIDARLDAAMSSPAMSPVEMIIQEAPQEEAPDVVPVEEDRKKELKEAPHLSVPQEKKQEAKTPTVVPISYKTDKKDIGLDSQKPGEKITAQPIEKPAEELKEKKPDNQITEKKADLSDLFKLEYPRFIDACPNYDRVNLSLLTYNVNLYGSKQQQSHKTSPSQFYLDFGENSNESDYLHRVNVGDNSIFIQYHTPNYQEEYKWNRQRDVFSGGWRDQEDRAYNIDITDPKIIAVFAKEVIRSLAQDKVGWAQTLYRWILDLEKLGKIVKDLEKAIQSLYVVDLVRIDKYFSDPLADLKHFVEEGNYQKPRHRRNGPKMSATVEPSINGDPIGSKTVTHITRYFLNDKALDAGLLFNLKIDF